MKKLSLFIAISLLGLQVYSSPATLEINNSRIQETETRKVSDFHGISTGGHFNVLVKMGEEESLRIESSTEALKNIETVVEHGVLKIRVKNRFIKPTADLGKVTVHVTARSLDALAVSGSGSMKVDGEIKARKLNTSVSGSGSLNFSADVSDFKAIISGSGSMNVRGKGTHAVVTVSGSGSFNAIDLKVDTAEIRLSGSGGATIHAEDHLSAVLIGSGNIRYSGDPHVDVTKGGAGSVSKI